MREGFLSSFVEIPLPYFYCGSGEGEHVQTDDLFVLVVALRHSRGYTYFSHKCTRLDLSTVWLSRHRHLVGFFNVHGQAQTRNHLFTVLPMDRTPLWCSEVGTYILPPWTELSRKYLGTDKCIFRRGGGVQDSIYAVMSLLLAWRCHWQRRYDVVLWTTSKSDYLLKIKAWEKINQSLTVHSGKDKGIPSSCPRFAIHDESLP